MTIHLFAPENQPLLHRWARQLRLFRFVQATGGFTNDGDRLEMTFGYASEEELLRFFAAVGLTPERGEKRPSGSITRAGDPVPIRGASGLLQPGHCAIFGESLFVWCENGRIRLTVNGGRYEVTLADAQKAARLEGRLTAVSLPIVDPPVDHPYCLCPKHHPQLFA